MIESYILGIARKLKITPACKVNLASTVVFFIESTPVSYSWFPEQVGLARILPNPSLITDLPEIAGLICISSPGVCGGKDF
jgi:hypothetical protein